MISTGLSGVLELAAADVDAGTAFWSAVTGHDVTRTPDPLTVQRVDDGPSRVRLDLHVADIDAAATRAGSLGATLQARWEHAVVRSPGGFSFAFLADRQADRMGAAHWPGGWRSMLDTVCLDIAPAAYDVEREFWCRLTGWRSRVLPLEAYTALEAEDLPMRILLQRREEGDDPVTAHLDVSTDDRPCEVARHHQLGAEVVATLDYWTVLRDPAGLAYCIVGRDPEMPMLSVGADA